MDLVSSSAVLVVEMGEENERIEGKAVPQRWWSSRSALLEKQGGDDGLEVATWDVKVVLPSE